MNTAMRVLLDKRTEDQQRAEEIIRMNLKELIDPYLDRLAQSGLNRSQEQLLDVVRMNLEDVLGSAVPEFSSKYYMLSPNEIQVVNLVRKGKTTKEMSRLLNLSVRTVEAYRNSIRKKLNLKNKKINLRTYLASISLRARMIRKRRALQTIDQNKDMIKQPLPDPPAADPSLFDIVELEPSLVLSSRGPDKSTITPLTEPSASSSPPSTI